MISLAIFTLCLLPVLTSFMAIDSTSFPKDLANKQCCLSSCHDSPQSPWLFLYLRNVFETLNLPQSPSMGIRRKIIILFKIVNDVLFYSLLKVFSLSARVAEMKMHSRLSGGWLDVTCLFLSRIHSKGSLIFVLFPRLNLLLMLKLREILNNCEST